MAIKTAPANLNTDTILESNFSVVGPTGSGKTTLLDAFDFALKNIHHHEMIVPEDYPMVMDLEIIKAQTQQGEEKNGEGDIIESARQATRQKLAKRFTFRRVPKLDAGQSPSYEQQVSTYTHSIVMIDNMGSVFAHLLNSLPRTKNTDENDQKIYKQLDDSEGILVVLDHTMIKGNKHFNNDLQLGGTTDERRAYTKAEYTDMIGCLLEIKTTKRLKVAFCVTKADFYREYVWFPTRGKSQEFEFSIKPNDLIEEAFGNGMISLINDVGKKHDVGTFIVSTLGFFQKDGAWAQNYDPGTAWLLNTNLWWPINVHMPFWWLFQKIEEDHLERISQRSFPVQFIGNKLSEVRRSLYIPYPLEHRP